LALNVFITGFSYTGKTSIAKIVSAQLNRPLVDIDSEIVKEAGKPIAVIFSDHSEEYFRKLEHNKLVEISKYSNQIVATGGGLVNDDSNRETMHSTGLIFNLRAKPQTVYERILKSELTKKTELIRPLIKRDQSKQSITDLMAQRESNYSDADWTIHTDNISINQVAGEVIRAIQNLDRSIEKGDLILEDIAAKVLTASTIYSIYAGHHIIDSIGLKIKSISDAKIVYLITDRNTHLIGRKVQLSLERVGIKTHILILDPGESTKNLKTASLVYQWLAELKAERKHLIIAIGGGVIGDLAGFVASTFLRGIPFVQVPTSLASMVDASIGGKVAINLSQGKNLVGSFYQPLCVITDFQVLSTLPTRELISGWAEAIKHGLILDDNLVELFETSYARIKKLEPNITSDVIKRSIAIKASIVTEDEKEIFGKRILLNYGHTIGHALEAATSYKNLLHGEAISIGMIAASRISAKMGLISEDIVKRQKNLLDKFGLPTSFENLDVESVQLLMKSDKKTMDGNINWVLLNDIGQAVVRSDVPDDIVKEVLLSLTTDNNITSSN